MRANTRNAPLKNEKIRPENLLDVRAQKKGYEAFLKTILKTVLRGDERWGRPISRLNCRTEIRSESLPFHGIHSDRPVQGNGAVLGGRVKCPAPSSSAARWAGFSR